MLKLVAAALLAASALAVDDYCCELYHDANYGGAMQKVCPHTDIHGNMKVTPKSFKDTSDDGKMSSYKCGIKVHAQMCPEAWQSKFSHTTWTHEYTCNSNTGALGIFATDVNKANDNLETPTLGQNEDNFLSSIILGQCEGKGQCGAVPQPCPIGQRNINGTCFCSDGSLPVNGICSNVGKDLGFICNMLDCDDVTGSCLPIPFGGVQDTTGFFQGHAAGDLIKSIITHKFVTVQYYESVSFGGNSHNVANESSLKICTQVENGALKNHHEVNSIRAFVN